MGSKINKILNIFLYLIVGIIIFQRIPEIIEHFKKESQQSPLFEVQLLSQNYKFTLQDKIGEPLILVFWATWCGPCEVELSRINKLIKSKKLKSESVLAISSYESKELIDKVVRERNYLFMIGFDEEGVVAKSFKVNGTPTVVLLDKDHKIKWFTNGISPSLEYRLLNL